MTATGSSSQRSAGDLDREAKLPLIAVIAVHGVADQAPNESARQIAKLLLSKRYDRTAANYTSFREYPLRIPVDPPFAPCDDGACAVDAPATSAPDAAASSVDLDLTHRLLHQYESKRTPYDTVRLEGHRLRQPKKSDEQTDWIARDQCHVHVYELFWADLSRLGTGLVGFIGAIYQLVSSLAQLGMRTIRHARDSQDPTETSIRWTSYLQPHRFAVWLLTVLVPYLNLAILGAALTMLVARVPKNTQAAFLAVIVVVLVLGLRTFVRLRATKAQRLSKGPSTIWLIVWGLVGVYVYWRLTRVTGDVVTMRLLTSAWIVLQTAALIYLGHIFETRINTAFRVGIVVSVPTAALLLAFVWMADDVVQVAHGAVRTIELLFFGLTMAWILLTAAGIVSAVGAARVLKAPGLPRPDRARRAAWTAASTLAVSTASLSALTLFVWAALYAVLSASLPAPRPGMVRTTPTEATDPSHQPVRMRSITPDTSYLYRPLDTHVLLASRRSGVCFDQVAHQGVRTRVGTCDRFSLKSILRTLLSVSAMSGLMVNGFALLLTGAIGLWLALPSVLQEIRPRTDPADRPERSVALGVWLTQGFVSLRKAAVGVYGLIFGGTGVVIALAVWMFFSREQTPGAIARVFEVLQPRSDAFIFGLGSLVAASTVGLVALMTRFQSWSNAVRPVLDVALDVDNYLKSRPVHRTPRARMMERFVALLRYVTRWRRDGAGYDAIIIIAHSQGTVLASELLRYQKARGFEDLSLRTGYPWRTAHGDIKPTTLSVDLFTMGSPLRQLYTSSFPDLFAWTELPQPTGPNDPGRAFCDTLGVRRWWNVYRSGDYVGRALWQYRGEETAYKPGVWCAKGESCREQCLGPGAHTHYWDENGTDVGKVLDEMIALAYEDSPRK